MAAHPDPHLLEEKRRLEKRVSELEARLADLHARGIAQLAAIVESSDDAIISKTLEGVIVTWNSGAEHVYGYSSGEAVGQSIALLVPAERMAEEGEILERIRRGERMDHFETVRVAKGGRRIYVTLTISPIRDASGRIVGASHIARDISRRRLDEERLRQSERRFHIIADAAPVMIWMAAADGLATWFNKTWLEFTGRPMNQEVGCGWSEGLHPDDRGKVLESLDRAFQSRESIEIEYRHRRHDGEYRWLLKHGVPLFGDGGEFTGFVGSCIDITSRKLGAEAVVQSEAKLRAYFESASQGIIAVDAGGRILEINARTEELFGYSREELEGQNLELLLPERLRGMHAGHRSHYFGAPRTRPMGAGLDLAGLRKDGTEFPVEIGLSFVPTAGGGTAMAFISDITARKRLEDQLRQTQKLESLGVLAGGVAHDFNNLLTGILGNASLALDTLSPANPAAVMLRDIVAAGERAAHLTRQLLAYAGKGRFIVEPLDLSELMREISNLIQTSIPRTVQLRLELQPDLPTIAADASQIQQLVMNLVINGAEAVPENQTGTVLVTTGAQDVDESYLHTVIAPGEIAPGRYVTLEVHDTGAGMDEETISRIFDPFFTTKFTGRGLGLAAVQGIVRGHKGALKVYSSPGKGTTFKVLLPAARDLPASPPWAGLAEELTGTGTILVIDDEPVVRRTAKSMLERYGYTVVLAENGREGVDLFRVLADKLALVLLDMTMPVMSGEETLRALKAIRPEVKVVLSSGFNEVEAIRRFTGKGLAGFVQKPYTSTRLAEKMKAILGQG